MLKKMFLCITTIQERLYPMRRFLCQTLLTDKYTYLAFFVEKTFKIRCQHECNFVEILPSSIKYRTHLANKKRNEQN